MFQPIRSVLLLSVLFASTTGLADEQPKLADSLSKWQQLKEKHAGNYSYAVRWSSFAGFGHETVIVVRDNQVVERRYVEFGREVAPVAPGPKPPKPAGPKWVETASELGKHNEGAPPKTLDALYAEAAKVLQQPLRDSERRYVKFDQQGLLLSCFIVDTAIADDAPITGVRLARITPGESGKPDAGKNGKVHRAPNGKPFPKHWGAPPRIQTKDLRPLPGGYGRGSGTLARWIQMNLDKDRK